MGIKQTAPERSSPEVPETVLAFDTASAACSVAVWRRGHVVARRFQAMPRGHAEALVPMIAEVLAEAGLAISEIDRLAVTVGPGAFTGLRVGLAVARGLALATGRPLVGLTSFEIIAHGLSPEQRQGRALLVAVDSRRPDLFLQGFGADLGPRGDPWLATPDACAQALPAGPLLVAGCGVPALRAALSARSDTHFAEGPGWPDAAVAAILAAGLPPGGGLPARPLYLRLPDVTLPGGTVP